jgi:pyruvate dehydrogenase E2 component (dihydrolipoamide acetyltransferase)
MPTEVFMPQLGLTMTEGTVARWLKKEGDQVSKGEAILEVTTDKATVEVEAAGTGVLAGVRVADGQTVPTGQVIAYILSQGETLPVEPTGSPRALGKEGSIAAISTSGPSSTVSLWVAGAGVPEAMLPARTSRRTLKVSPRARHLADQTGIELRTIKGTGPMGRIIEADVRRAIHISPRGSSISPVAQRLAKELGVDPNVVRGTGPGGRVTKADVQQASGPQIADGTRLGNPGNDTDQLRDLWPLQGIRKLVAERMAFSASTVPHFHLTVEVDATMLARMRDRLAPEIETRTHARLTFTDLLIYIIARSIVHHPEVNVAWADGAVLRQHTIGIGVATATIDGLVVPVIQDADKKSLATVVVERQKLTELARAGRLSLQNLEGGTFTLTNLGMYGVDVFDPIINTPQSAILAVGQIKERPLAIAGQVIVRPAMYYTLAVDHRLLDGAQAARFLDTLVRLTEEPYLLVDDLLTPTHVT